MRDFVLVLEKLKMNMLHAEIIKLEIKFIHQLLPKQNQTDDF